MPESPNTELLTLGKGIMSVAEWSGGSPGAWRDVGEETEFNVQVSVSMLDYISNRSGSGTLVKQAVLTRGYTINFSLSEMGLKNLEMYLQGSKQGNTIHALTKTGAKREFAIKFKQQNPEGPNGTYEFWKAKIIPNGAKQMIGQEWMVLPHVANGLADTVNHADTDEDSIYFDARYSTTTTTTTTTTSTTTTTTAP